MIDHLDNLIRHLLITNLANINLDQQIRFQPPDSDWQTAVSNLNSVALNIFLADLRENRKLRSNKRQPASITNGTLQTSVAPMRVDCHYLISAWIPAQPFPFEPTVSEHQLLYETTAVIANNIPLNPTRVYGFGAPPLATVPELIRNVDLPTQLLPAEGFPKLADFWGAMGTNTRWKPMLYLIVTLPVALQNEVAGPMVTTLVTEYRHAQNPQMTETRIEIGGRVLNTAVSPEEAIPNAWIQLQQLDGTPLQTTHSNSDGQFIFSHLNPGPYQLAWRSAGFPNPPAPRLIQVPSPSGEYDLLFT